MRAAMLIGVPGDLKHFEELIRRYSGWAELCFRLETMSKADALKGGHRVNNIYRTWKQELDFLSDAWYVFQSLPAVILEQNGLE